MPYLVNLRYSDNGRAELRAGRVKQVHKPGPFGIVLYALLACAAILAIGTTVQRYTTHATIFVPPAMTHHAKPITQ